MTAIVKGYIIEGDNRGLYYHRTGTWMEYDSPAKAYVWTVPQVQHIERQFQATPERWPVAPAFLYPATYNDETGVTVITGPHQDFPLTASKSASTDDSKQVGSDVLSLGTKELSGRRFVLRVKDVGGHVGALENGTSL